MITLTQNQHTEAMETQLLHEKMLVHTPLPPPRLMESFLDMVSFPLQDLRLVHW